MADHWAEAEEISIDLNTLRKSPTGKCSRLILWRIQALQYLLFTFNIENM